MTGSRNPYVALSESYHTMASAIVDLWVHSTAWREPFAAQCFRTFLRGMIQNLPDYPDTRDMLVSTLTVLHMEKLGVPTGDNKPLIVAFYDELEGAVAMTLKGMKDANPV